MKHWPRNQMLSQKLYTLSKEEEVVVTEVEEDEETTFADEEDKVTSGPKSGAAGAAPILTTLTIVGRRTATTNGREVVIGRAETAMNAEKQDTSRRIVQSVEAEMEAEMVTEADSTVEASEKILDQEVKDPVKKTDTTDRSFLEMAQTIRNDSRGRPHSIQR